MTPNGQSRDPVIFEAPYFRNGARWTHGHHCTMARGIRKGQEKAKRRRRKRIRGRKRGKIKGKGKEKRGKGKKKGKGEEKGMEKRKEKKKENGEGERGRGRKKRKDKGKGKRKERWKEDSLRNVGRTDARTQRWFYTLSNAMRCIGQTITFCNEYDGGLYAAPCYNIRCV